MLSLIPKANEYGIARGLDESKCPQDIELDWDTFAEIIGLNEDKHEEVVENPLQKLLDKIKPSTPSRQGRPSAAQATANAQKETTLPQASAVQKATVTKAASETKTVEKKAETTKATVEKKEDVKPTISTASKEEVVKAIKEKDATAKMHENAEQPETIFDQPIEEEKPVVKTVEAKPVSTAQANDINAKLAALKALKNKK